MRRSLAGGREEDGPPEVLRMCVGNVSSKYCTSTSCRRPESEFATPLRRRGTLAFEGGVSLYNADMRS